MDHLERVGRLRQLLGRISPESSLENFAPQLEVLRTGDAEEEIAQAGLDVLLAGDVTDPEQTLALEAIVHKRYRPVVNIINDTYGTVPAPWTALGTGAAKARIEATLRSIGRIEVPLDPRGRPYAGTGFVVGDNLLMTNRHVAMIFASGVGTQGLSFIPGQVAGVDFKQEIVPAEPRILNVEKVVMIHPYWDMALLRVSDLSSDRPQLALSTLPADGNEPRDVVVIGYPAQDDRNPMALQNEIFGGIFHVKRLQPGKLLARREVESFGRKVSAVTHDSSTLGGNSGSAVVDVATGEVIGLHFAGLYLDANFAVPTDELARDSRVVNAGVRFAGTVAPSDVYPSVWQLVSAEQSPLAGSPGATVQSPAPHSPSTTADPPHDSNSRRELPANAADCVGGGAASAVTWTIPLQVTVTLGTPTQVGVALAADDRLARVEGMFGGRARPSVENIPPFSLPRLSTTGFDWRTALGLAQASQLSYESKQATLDTTRHVWGFESCEFIEAAHTQCFVSVSPRLALVAFRGTESLRDWLYDLDLAQVERPYGTVHRGFLRAFEAVQAQLGEVLTPLAARPLLITGHSLGGAIATMAAAEWRGVFQVAGVYTYGQPAVGRGTFPGIVDSSYPASFFRVVNDDDIVPRVPPNYRHVGQLIHFDESGVARRELAAATENAGLAQADDVMDDKEFAEFQRRLGPSASLRSGVHAESTFGFEEGLLPSFSDHRLEAYVSKIARYVT